MNALVPEGLLRLPSAQDDLPLATDGVYRLVWQSRFGPILIEVIDGVAFVNGSRVEAAAPERAFP